MRRTLPAVVLLLVVAACGVSGDDRSGDPTTPSPATTRSSTISTLVDYGDDQVVVARAADVAKLTAAPKDFKRFLVAELKRQQDTKDEVCTERPEIRVAKVDTRGWAAGGRFVPECGGSATLWAKVASRWREVWGGQTLPDCAVLERFRFPPAVAGGECGTADGATRRYPD